MEKGETKMNLKRFFCSHIYKAIDQIPLDTYVYRWAYSAFTNEVEYLPYDQFMITFKCVLCDKIKYVKVEHKRVF